MINAIKNPDTLSELRALEAENNVIVKFTKPGCTTGIFPAYRKVARWIGSEDKWDVFFVAAKQYHTLLDLKLKSNVSYDVMMGSLKNEYKDYTGRVAMVFRSEIEAKKYLSL
jgi:hypothetical protein